MSPQRPIAAVVATTQAWPEAEACLDSMHAQVEAAGGEIVLGDGSPRGMPREQLSRYPRLRCLHIPGASVFRLREAAVAAAKAEIVAVTEDHCTVAPDWCEAVLRAHREHPAAAAVGGAVENGATATQIDWASFFMVNGASMPPLANGERRSIALQANVSYKRAALPAGARSLGQMEWLLNRDLLRAGAVLVSDDRIRVTHVQSLGVRNTCRIHYDDGRTIAAFRLERMGAAERATRLAACVVMPAFLVARTLVHVIPKRRHLGTLTLAVPWIVVLSCCKAWGNVMGFLFGPGPSPERIR